MQVKKNSSPDERALALSLMVEDFDEKNKFELMLLDFDGNILATSSGFIQKKNDYPEDYARAQKSADGMGEYIYTSSSNERVLAVSYLVPGLAGDISAIRFVTSLTRLNSQIVVTILVSMAFVIVVLVFCIFSGLYFVRSIVNPIKEVEKTAARIAQGDFSARLMNKYDDEVGRLCKTINGMAVELGKTEQLKNEFISSVSHELRTPLTSIKGWIETLARVDDPTNVNYKRGMEIVMCETDRLYKMVEELLDFSRLQHGGLSLSLEKLDLVAEVSDVVLMVEQRAKSEGIILSYNEPEDFIIINADTNRLRQVFVNVIDNAFKYSSRGCTVKIEMEKDAENAFVRVVDQGPGISPDELEKVKIKFYKGKGAVRGSGIGLAVVNEILTAHGGDFKIESTQGVGTTIIMRLPLFKAENN
ncbi:MAG: HAMP domain-containing sensor histidine kinase, partial [Oscillospiraceae bacterium]